MCCDRPLRLVSPGVGERSARRRRCGQAAPPDPPGEVSVPAGLADAEADHATDVVIEELPTDEVIAPGKIEANPNRVSKVVLPVTGRITRVLVKTGDAVSKDQPLLTIQSPDADAAMSTFLSAQAASRRRRRRWSRRRPTSIARRICSSTTRWRRRTCCLPRARWRRRQAALEQAQAAREQAARRLAVLGLTPGDFKQEVVLRSPLAGKVLELSVVPGEFRNDTSASVMTIADLSTVWVTSQVPESYIRFVQVGERVEISLVAYPGETFEGRVSRIADTVDPQTRTVKVQAEMDKRHAADSGRRCSAASTTSSRPRG